MHLLQVLVSDPGDSGGQTIRLLPVARKAMLAIVPLCILEDVQRGIRRALA